VLICRNDRMGERAQPDEEQDMLLGQQLGAHAPSTYGNDWDTTLAAARACEQAGLDSVWLVNHFMFQTNRSRIGTCQSSTVSSPWARLRPAHHASAVWRDL
jgi:alkanesulfonate monooxygenase SsuD/methylene tetrahydromethanopterin reductase-like flavin-dependent oxidoreductase (luciferase family)